jgi:hypothetical protein
VNRYIGTVLGIQGYGKTFFTKWFLSQQAAPVVIADSMGEYSGTGREVKHFSGWHDALSAVRRRRGKWPARFNVVKIESDSDAAGLFMMIKMMHSPCTLIVEEADKFMNAYGMDESLKSLINYGRHACINLLFIARRASAVNRLVTSQSNFIVSFRQSEKIDVAYMRNFSDIFSTLPDLPRHEFIAAGEFGEGSGIISKPGKYKIDNHNKLKEI